MLARPADIDPRRVAAYVRWSTDEQAQGTTLAIQRERVALFIRSQGWEFREELLFLDDGYSGATLDRPGMQTLRSAVQDGDVACVVVYRLDRLSRSLVDTVNLVRREWKERCMLFSATENFDTASPVGQMVFNILVSFAEFERTLIRDRTLAGKRKRAQQGRNAGQKYPYGYERGAGGEWVLNGRDEATGRLTGPAAVARQIFDMFLGGESMGAIASRFNADGVPGPEGRRWRFGGVGRILANPVYAGTYRYGAGEVAGAVPPIVTPAEFATAADLRVARAGRRDKAEAGRYLLSGLARCARCEGAVAGSMGKTRRYYVCTGRAAPHRRCDCAYMDAATLEEAVLRAARQQIGLPDLRAEAGRLVQDLDGLLRARREAVAQASAALQTAGRRRQRLEDEFLDGAMDGRIFSGLIAKVETETADAGTRLHQASAALQTVESAAAQPDVLLKIAADADPWAELSFAETRQVLRELTGALEVYQCKSAPGSRYGNPNPLTITWQPRMA